MRVLLAAGLLGLAILFVYPTLLAVSLVTDALLGDGSVSLNLFPLNPLRLSLSGLLWNWVRSLPVAISLIATLLTLFYLAHKFPRKANVKLMISLLGLLIVFVMGTYIGDSYINGLIYIICVAVVGTMFSVVFRVTSRMLSNEHS